MIFHRATVKKLDNPNCTKKKSRWVVSLFFFFDEEEKEKQQLNVHSKQFFATHFGEGV